MADILISKFTTQIPRVGATPATPGFAESEGQDPVAPSGTPIQYGIGVGLSLDSLNRIQIGKEPYPEGRVIDLSEWGVGGNSDFVITNSISNGDDESFFNVWRYPSQNGFLYYTYKSDYSSRIFMDSTKSGSNESASFRFSVLSPVGDLGLFMRNSNISDSIGEAYAYFIDSRNSKGLQYFDDYSAVGTLDPRWIPDWGAVTGAIASAGHSPVTIGSPANGLSISGTQVLTIGLASTSDNGALSSTDWNTFNNKLNLTSPITGYTVGANTALAATDTILQAFGKVQGQINARISGTIASGQVAFGTGVNTVGGDSGLTWNNTTKTLIVNTIAIGLGGGNISTNTRVGLNTLDSNTTGANNSSFGVFSLQNNTTGSNNTSVGSASLRNINSGSQNTAIGANAGRFISGGTNLTTSNNSVFIGHDTRANADSETNQIVIGNSAIGGGSNTTTIGNSSTVSTRLPAGSLWVNTTSGTNTLDINGTARIRTISNLGSAATSVLVPSATGVISLRTLAELAADMGNQWTSVGANIYRNSQVTIGQTSIITADLGINQVTTNSAFRTNALALATRRTVHNVFESTTERYRLDNYGIPQWLCYDTSTPASLALAFTIPQTNQIGILTAQDWTYATGTRGYISWNPTNTSGTVDSCVIAVRNNVSLGMTATGRMKYGVGSGYGTAVSHSFSLISGDTTVIGCYGQLGIYNSLGANTLNINQTGDIQVVNASGIKIGTATNQRLGFFNATPIVQPSGDILTALSNLGLIASPTITQVDQFAVKTTASADQTLPSGVLTILDYDTTLTNNSTATYTVGTTGRITINTTGIYTITAGVVIEADAVTALESAFLGIFRNGDLVAISSINTTIAAGAQSGLSTSTILSLTATDIIDCRALVNSVGGVANGLARRLGTLLGANATQVNSLSITKNSM